MQYEQQQQQQSQQQQQQQQQSHNARNVADDLNPLSIGETHENGMLEDFSLFWGTSQNHASSPVKETILKPVGWGDAGSGLHRRSHSGTENTTQTSDQTTSVVSSTLRRGTATSTSGNVSFASSQDQPSAVSIDTDDTSRNSVKRRRTAIPPYGFEPLAPCKEDDKDVRPYMVEVCDNDVVLGDTHEPTWGTKIYREVRKPYAKKTLDNEQLKNVKTEFQRRLEKDLGHKLKGPPTFWVNKENSNKSKQNNVVGFLKNRPGITYAYAKDQSVKDDIKNASARSRTRSTKVFNCKGSLVEVLDRALRTLNEWVGNDADKELYAVNFREDLKRLAPWHSSYIDKRNDFQGRAQTEPELRGTHMRASKIHQAHASNLETALVDMINQMGNLMVESQRNASKRSNGGPGTVKSSGSVDGSISYASSSKEPSMNNTRSKPPLGIRSVPERTTHLRRTSAVGRSRVARRGGRDEVHGNIITVSSNNNYAGAHMRDDHRGAMEEDSFSVDMDVSPISVRKAMLTKNLGQTFVMPSNSNNDKLEAMFTTLRMGTGDDVPREVDQQAPDELSVLSMPDDVTVLLEARELAIRRGIDLPAALPRPGHVAQSTKALLQQLGSKGAKKEG